MKTINNKKQMYALYEGGAFGNKLRTWDSLQDYYKSTYYGTVSMRYKGKSGGGWTAYNVERIAVNSIVEKWENEGADVNLIVLNESAPDDRLTIQGEVMRDFTGLYVFWSDLKTKMRIAMQQGKEAKGLAAKFLLQKHLTPASYDDIMDLLDMYPDSVIEFSAYQMCLGDKRGRNAVIWECRNY